MICQPQYFRRVARFLLWLSIAVVPFACGDVDQNELDSLVLRFQAQDSFWRQFEVGNEVSELADPRALVKLEPWLRHKDRHVRGNVAFIYAKLGDPRGLATIMGILDDYSGDRRVEWQGGSLLFGENETLDRAMARMLRSPAGLRAQIRTDRYYAVHLLGVLRDPRSVEVLVPLLADETINHKVAWALGEIQDDRVIPPLMAALSDSDALVRTNAIQSLERLRAAEAIPRLRAMLSDTALPSAGPRQPVGRAARDALETLQREP